mgnify:CR=1 FL=1
MTTNDTSNDLKLSISETLKEIFQFLWAARYSFIFLTTIPVTALTSYWAAMVGLAGITEPGNIANPATLWELCVLYTPSLILFSIFAVTWHQHYLNRGIQVGIKDALIPSPKHLKYFFSALLVTLIALAIISVPIVIVIIFTLVINFAAGGEVKPPVDVETVSVFISTVASVLFFCVFLRLAQWLPVIATASPLTLLEAWRLGRGNTWRLFAISCGANIVPAILCVLYQLTPSNLDLILIYPYDSWTVFAKLLGEYAVSYLMLAFLIATISICYDRLLARIANDPLYTLNSSPFSSK